MKNSKRKILKGTVGKIIPLVTFYFCLLTCFSQQPPQYTQFMLNNYGLNPAAAGVSPNKIEAMFGIRRQWAGFKDFPVTTFFNVTSYFGRRNSFNNGWHGVGAYWQGDRMGQIIKTDDFYASYTYLMRIVRKGYISFGMAAGARRYGFRITDFFDPVMNANNVWLYPDIIPGVKFWNNKWSFDVSVKQLYKNKVKQGGNEVGSPAKLPPHFYFSGSYKWWAQSWLLVVQSVHVKYQFATLPSVDYNILAHLNKNFAVGLSYRHFDAVAAVVQYRFDKLVAGAAYDYSVAPYRVGFAGSQEFMLGLSPSPYYGSDGDAKKYRTAECPSFQY